VHLAARRARQSDALNLQALCAEDTRIWRAAAVRDQRRPEARTAGGGGARAARTVSTDAPSVSRLSNARKEAPFVRLDVCRTLLLRWCYYYFFLQFSP
jgi:hypothetical protein